MIVYGIFFAFIGYIFTAILMDDVLIGYRRFLIMNRFIPEWAAKPLGLCPVCFTGQLSLWGSIPLVEWNYYGIVAWFGVISINMIMVLIFLKYVKNETD